MKTIPILALLAVASASCTTLLDPSKSGDDVAIVSLAPTSGPIGTRVTVNGSGLSSTANTVTFTAVAVDGETPNEPSVIPDLPSANGTTISFERVVGLASTHAAYRGARAMSVCQDPNVARVPYRVAVTNTAGTSNGHVVHCDALRTSPGARRARALCVLRMAELRHRPVPVPA